MQKKDHCLYVKLAYRDLIKEIPLLQEQRNFNGEYLEYYYEHYKGLTRGQLFIKDSSFYNALSKKGLLKHVPLKRKN